MPIDKVDLNRFLNQIRLRAPGVSDAGAKAELFEVLDNFSDLSNAWQEAINLNVLAGSSTNTNQTYTLVPQQGGTIIRLIAAYDSNNIPQPCFMPTGDPGTTEVGQLTFVNSFNLNQVIRVIVAKSVILPASDDMVPDYDHTVFRRYIRTIIDGVLARLMMQKNKPYTDNQLAQYHLAQYDYGAAMARAQTERQNTQGAQAWSYPQTFRVRGQRGGVSTANPTQFGNG
jgi:hypothetical protein